MRGELFILFVIAATLFKEASAMNGISNSIMNENIVRRRQNQEMRGDFDRLNSLLETVSISIDDDMVVSKKVGLLDLNLVIENLKCQDISIGNVEVSHASVDNSIDVGIALNGIDATCQIEYQYEYGFLKGTSKVEFVTNGNAADTSIEFVAYTENGEFVTKSSISNCLINIEISDVNFIDADLASKAVGLFEKYFRELIEEQIEKYACSEFSTRGAEFLNNDMFTMVTETLLSLANAEDNVGDTKALQQNDLNATQALNFRDIERVLSRFDQLFRGDDNILSVNNFLRSYLLDENGTLVLKITELLGKDAMNFELHNELTKTLITIQEVRIVGLDSMTKFDPFLVDGDHTIRNEFSWNSLDFSIDVLLDIRPSSLEDAILKQDIGSEQEGIVEQITIEIGAKDIDVFASIFALIDIETLGGLTIGSLLALTNVEDYEWVRSCLMSAVKALHFIDLQISPQQINAPTLKGFIDDGLDRILSDLTEIAFEMYYELLLDDVLPAMIRNTVRASINDIMNRALEGSRSSPDECTKYNEVPTVHAANYVDFRELFGSSTTFVETSTYGELPSMLRTVIDNELLSVNPTTGMPKLNDVLIDTLTKGQSGIEGTLLFGGDDGQGFDIIERIKIGGFDTNVRLSASDIRIENLDTVVAPLTLMEPVLTEPHTLNNSVTIGVEGRPVKLAARFAFEIIDNIEGDEISNEVEIDIDMHTANVLTSVMLKIAKSRLLGFPLLDIFDLNCWVATIPAPTLNDQGVRIGDDDINATILEFVATVAELNLNVACLECSSPGMIELSELLMTSSEAKNDVSLAANMLLTSASDLVTGDFMQVQIDRLLNNASRQCRHSQNYDPNFKPDGTAPNSQQYSDFEAVKIENSTTYLMLVGVVSLVIILMVGSLFFSIQCFIRRRHKRWLTTLTTEKIKALEHIQQREVSMELAMNSTTSSMFRSSKDIPFVLRWGMPFVIIGNIALFISGHLNLGATVNIEATVAGETIKVDNFFEFSMAKSTIDIWNAGGKELAILILIFSGIWPYTKQLITLFLWFSPPHWVSMSRRGTILVWLDRLGKWSMIDIFVLIICIAAFRVSVNSPSQLSFLPTGFYSLDLLVVPLWGLYANLIAQLVSQISSHFIIYYHRKIATRARDYHLRSSINPPIMQGQNSDQQDILHSHHYRRPHRGEKEKLIVRSWVNYLFVFVIISSILCIVAGCIFPSFSIEVFGVLGVAIEFGQEFQDAKTYQSVFRVIKLLFEQAKFLESTKYYVGLGSFSIILAFTVLIVPICQNLALLVQWFVPMTIKKRMKMSMFVEILQAWQYAEVYILAIFVASWQLGPISSFMVNSYCDSLDGFLSELVFYGVLKTEDAQCFSVKSVIEEGFFILAIGAILLTLVNTAVTKATTQYCRDQDDLDRENQVRKQTSTLECAEEGQEGTTNHSELELRSPPVLFTDTFRWLLKRDTIELSCDELG